MLKTKTIIFLIIITIFSFFLRIYKIDVKPSGILPDEASFGYNAFSILKTGKDEHGISYPISFKAFGDQKLPLQTYLIVPSISIFGLNNFAVRLPSAISGTLITAIIFFFLIELGFTSNIALFGSLITAVSPWTIILSRFAFESNLGLLLFLLGIIFFLKGFKKNSLLLFIFSGIFFGLTFYSYIVYRVITPIIIFILYLIFIGKKINKTNLLTLLSFLIIILPLCKTLASNQNTARLSQVSVNSNIGTVLEINENRTFCTQYLPKTICYINANKLISYSRNFLYRYLNLFSVDYLFLNGDKISKYINVDYFGLLPLILLPFYFLGLIFLFNKTVNKKFSKFELFLLFGLIITPLPALIVSDPQKIRLSSLFPFLIILISYGAKSLNKQLQLLLNFLLVVSGLFFIVNLLFIHVQKYEIAYLTYVPKLMKYLGEQDKTTNIYIKSITEAPIMYAYENRIDPVIFQRLAIRKEPDSIGFVHIKDLGNLHITDFSIEEIYCQNKDNRSKILYITNEDFIKTNRISKVNKIIRSENQVDILAFIYDVSYLYTDSINCQQFK